MKTSMYKSTLNKIKLKLDILINFDVFKAHEVDYMKRTGLVNKNKSQ